MTEMDDYLTAIRGEDDTELLYRLRTLARFADRFDSAIVDGRVPVLVAELERRDCFENADLADWMKPLSDAAHRSTRPVLVALAQRIGLRKSRAIRFDCPLCLRPRLRKGDTYCGSCTGVLYEALGVHGSFDATFKYMHQLAPLVRGQSLMCYLCGEEPTDHAEHVIPIAEGGQNRLSNLGGACWRCNLSKGDRIPEPTDDQKARLAQQQASVQATLEAVDVDAFWNLHMTECWEDSIADAVDDLDDFSDVDRDDVFPYIEDASDGDREDYPHMPRGLEDRAIDEVLRRVAEDR